MVLPTMNAQRLQARQIWALPTKTTGAPPRHCTPFKLPSRGVLNYDGTSLLTLTENAIFIPECTGQPSTQTNGTLDDPFLLRDPFYASTSPQIYAIAAATIISYMLVIMLFITPRTFFIGGAGGGGGFLGRRGIIRGTGGSASVVGVGSRPWLQKIATITVAMSLTIATVDTFRVAQEQYDHGYEDASRLTDEVVGGLEIRVIRVISDTFLWLAQVQTLIRLFPRHKEKVMIKWFGFGLIVLDTIFSILNGFFSESGGKRPRSFEDAIPALSYLFELALSLFYAACVIYYSLDKRRFAFLHRNMPNIGLVALISLVAILIPVVFFVLDISKPDVAGWGDYVRWVGQAAASVVVWEWVERIEALEREERKEGILGREVFDEDEIQDVTSAMEVNWIGSRHRRGGGNEGGAGDPRWPGLGQMTQRIPRPRGSHHKSPLHLRRLLFNRATSDTVRSTQGGDNLQASASQQPNIPLPVASPVSRNETTSAVSTLYAVRYHPISASTTPGPDMTGNTPSSRSDAPLVAHQQVIQAATPAISEESTEDSHMQRDTNTQQEEENRQEEITQLSTDSQTPISLGTRMQTRIRPSIESLARSLPNSLRLQRPSQGNSPDVATPSDSPSNSRTVHGVIRSELMSRAKRAKSAMDRFHGARSEKAPSAPLPSYYIPAQPRRRVWDPETGFVAAVEATSEHEVPRTHEAPVQEAGTRGTILSHRGSLRIQEHDSARDPNRLPRPVPEEQATRPPEEQVASSIQDMDPRFAGPL